MMAKQINAAREADAEGDDGPGSEEDEDELFVREYKGKKRTLDEENEDAMAHKKVHIC
jgi:hypothetical protein